jgi:eukaryotic-like serine/threonine-protein kinase
LQPDSMIGKTLSHYQVTEKLGQGGMGEVYLAQDTHLRRKVALKLLPAQFTNDADRLHRFEQEAYAASALNHPNILTIYEIGQVSDSHFIATEFIDGQTLRQQMTSRLRLTEALDVVIQVASALTAAHAAGILHRDIKPENVMLRPDGLVKVLDFGLAKLAERSSPRTGAEALTAAQVDTDPGTVMGTAQYMSPEQARGLKVDGRTDVFSLGVVLYEVVAGRAPFEGTTATDLIISIVEKEPAPLTRYSADVPAELQRIVNKALRKDRETRYQTVKDLLIDLKGLREELEFAAELERSGQANVTREGVTTSSGQGGAAAEREPAVSIEKVGALRTTSSAEYLVSEVRRHKGPALLALAILIIAGAAILYFARGGKAIDSVAVLPFVNASTDPDTEYLSDGITESLINSLSQLSRIKVIARSSVFRYKGRETDPRAVGRELGVQAVLTGRVMQRGDNLSISAELMDARDNSHIWGEQYNRKLADLPAVQQEITRDMSEKLRLKLSGEEQQRLTKSYTENTEAYQHYLKGLYYLDKSSEEGAKKAIEHFNQAIEIDPNYALAYVGLANAHLGLQFHNSLAPKDAYQRAKAAVLKAQEIDETLAEIHASLGIIKTRYDRDFVGAEREYKRAIQLKPNYAPAHSGYSLYLSAMGRHQEAITEAKRAQELEPLSVTNGDVLGYIFWQARQYDQSIEELRKTLEMEPNFALAHCDLGITYVLKGNYEEAIAEINKAVTLSGGEPIYISTLGYAYAVAGQRDEAEKRLAQLEELSKGRYVGPAQIALVYIGLGEKDQAFEWLEKAYKDRSITNENFALKVDPQFDTLRSDPRFADLLRRIGFPP